MKMRDKKVTINDVARYLGVSKSTVSHALSGKRQISAEVVEKVHKAIRELGYQPNFAAQVMNSHSTGLIGVLVCDMQGHTIRLINELTKHLKERNYSVTLCMTGQDEQSGLEMIRKVSNGMFDGILNTLPQVSAEKAMEAAGKTPLLTYLRHKKGAIYVDYTAGVRQVMEYLFQLGHKRIGYISTRFREFGEEDPYSVAYRDLMEKQGLFQPELLCHSSGELENGISAAEQLVHAGATAIFACNDETAAGVIQWAHANRIRIPEELSVVGSDNTQLAKAVYPPLTSVELFVEKIAEHTVKRLLEQIHGNEMIEIPPVIITPRLVLRDSTGPATKHPFNQTEKRIS